MDRIGLNSILDLFDQFNKSEVDQIDFDEAFYKWLELIRGMIYQGEEFEVLEIIRKLKIPQLELSERRFVLVAFKENERINNFFNRILANISSVLAELIESSFYIFDGPSGVFLEYLEEVLSTYAQLTDKFTIENWDDSTGFVNHLGEWIYQAKFVRALMKKEQNLESLIPDGYVSSTFIRETFRFIAKQLDASHPLRFRALPMNLEEALHGLRVITVLFDFKDSDNEIWDNSKDYTTLAIIYVECLIYNIMTEWKNKFRFSYLHNLIPKDDYSTKMDIGVNTLVAFFSCALEILNNQGKFGVHLAFNKLFSDRSGKKFHTGIDSSLYGCDENILEKTFTILLKYTNLDFWGKSIERIQDLKFRNMATRAGWKKD